MSKIDEPATLEACAADYAAAEAVRMRDNWDKPAMRSSGVNVPFAEPDEEDDQ